MNGRAGWLVASVLLLAMAVVTAMLSRDPRTQVVGEVPPTTTSTVRLTPTPTLAPPPERPTGTPVAISDLGRVWFVDRSHGFSVVGRRLVASEDRGRTWHVVGSPIPPDGLGYVPGNLVFTSPSDGYLYGRGIRVTHDGGASWTNPHLGRYVDVRDGPTDGLVLALQPLGRSVWALVTSPGTPATSHPWASIDLYISVDEGVTWRKASPPMLASPRGPFAQLIRVSATKAYALAPVGLEPESVFAYHHIALTEDGGPSWRYLEDPCRLTMSEELAAAGESDLWLVCGGEPATAMQGKEVYRSDDGGAHWRLVAATGVGGVEEQPIGNIPASGHLRELIAVSATRAYLGLSRYTQIQTTDGGATWQPSFLAPGGPDTGAGPANFVDTTHGWAFGERYLYRTTDGLEWQRIGGGRG